MVLCPPHGDNSLYASKGDLDLQTPSSQHPRRTKRVLFSTARLNRQSQLCLHQPPSGVLRGQGHPQTTEMSTGLLWLEVVILPGGKWTSSSLP